MRNDNSSSIWQRTIFTQKNCNYILLNFLAIYLLLNLCLCGGTHFPLFHLLINLFYFFIIFFQLRIRNAGLIEVFFLFIRNLLLFR